MAALQPVQEAQQNPLQRILDRGRKALIGPANFVLGNYRRFARGFRMRQDLGDASVASRKRQRRANNHSCECEK